MPLRSFILVNLVIIPAFIGFVAEEMNSRVLDAREVLLRRNVLQAVGFIPAGGENIEWDLSADGEAGSGAPEERGERLACYWRKMRKWERVRGERDRKRKLNWAGGRGGEWVGMYIRETKIRKFLLERLHEFHTDPMLLVVFLVVMALLSAGATADGGYIDHTISNLPKIFKSEPFFFSKS